MASKNVLTIAAKMVGGRAIVKEADQVSGAIEKTGRAAKHADSQAGSGKGWAVFSKQHKESTKAAEKHTKTLHGAAGGMLKYAASTVGVIGAVGLVKSSITDLGDTAAEIRQAKALGLGGDDRETLITLESYKQRGIGITQLGMGMKGIAKAQYAAAKQEEKYAAAQAKATASGKPMTAELGKQAKAFQALKINVPDFRKMTGTAQLKEITRALTAMPAGPERTRIASELLGKSAQKMLPLFTKGQLGVEGMEKAARDLIPQMKGGAKGFEEMEGKQLRLGLAMDGMKLTIGMALLPVVTKLMSSLVKLFSNISHGRGVWKGIGKDIKAVAKVLGEVWKWFKHNETAQKALAVVAALLIAAWAVQKVKNFVTAVKSLWLIQKLGIVATKAWAAAQWLLNAAMDANPIVLAVLAIAALVAVFVLAYKKVKWFREAVQDVWSWIKRHWPILAGVLLGPFVFVVIEIVKHWKQVTGFFESFGKGIVGIFKGIGVAIASVFKGIVNFGIIGPIDALLHAAHMLYRKIPDPLGVLPSWPLSDPAIPMLAKGGVIARHGSVIVGDRGPEVLHLPQGARVNPLSHGRSPGGMLGAFMEGSHGDLHVHVEIERHEIAQAVLKEFRKLEARSG